MNNIKNITYDTDQNTSPKSANGFIVEMFGTYQKRTQNHLMVVVVGKVKHFNYEFTKNTKEY